MTSVETARGSIASTNLGRVLMHEHVFVISTEIQNNYPDEWGDEETRISDAADRLNELKAAGIDTILDPTAIGLGRYIPRIQLVAARTDINIVCATGLYTFNELPHYYQRRSPVNGVDPMATHFVKDITDGFADTGIKAGVIKCATDKLGLTPDVERTLRACAQAHRETGCPITTHTNAETHRGLDQQKIFAEEGVDLSRVVIGHCGDTNDIDYLQALLDQGSILGMDRFGIDGYLNTEQRVEVVAELCNRGHASQLVLSHDASCYIDWIEGEVPLAPLPNWHYLHISQDVVPALLQMGVTDGQIDEMLIETPHRFLDSVNKGGY
ncbi:MAG: phosphotriesterase-related protein [Actinomycetota bacterium]|nr:phosphotriesterase-related protein [Actinomycetota bacterium]